MSRDGRAIDTGRMLELRDSGLSVKAIAAELGRSTSGVRVAAYRLGVSLERTPDDELRTRWAALLPRLKESLRRDILCDTA